MNEHSLPFANDNCGENTQKALLTEAFLKHEGTALRDFLSVVENIEVPADDFLPGGSKFATLAADPEILSQIDMKGWLEEVGAIYMRGSIPARVGDLLAANEKHRRIVVDGDWRAPSPEMLNLTDDCAGMAARYLAEDAPAPDHWRIRDVWGCFCPDDRGRLPVREGLLRDMADILPDIQHDTLTRIGKDWSLFIETAAEVSGLKDKPSPQMATSIKKAARGVIQAITDEAAALALALAHWGNAAEVLFQHTAWKCGKDRGIFDPRKDYYKRTVTWRCDT